MGIVGNISKNSEWYINLQFYKELRYLPAASVGFHNRPGLLLEAHEL